MERKWFLLAEGRKKRRAKSSGFAENCRDDAWNTLIFKWVNEIWKERALLKVWGTFKMSDLCQWPVVATCCSGRAFEFCCLMGDKWRPPGGGELNSTQWLYNNLMIFKGLFLIWHQKLYWLRQCPWFWSKSQDRGAPRRPSDSSHKDVSMILPLPV